jgi:hypothetical protein
LPTREDTSLQEIPDQFNITKDTRMQSNSGQEMATDSDTQVVWPLIATTCSSREKVSSHQ